MALPFLFYIVDESGNFDPTLNIIKFNRNSIVLG
jgi:hypothetical protein